MSKTEATRRRKRPSKVVRNEVVEEEDNTTTTKEIGTEESKDMEMNQAMEEAGDNEDSQMDMAIEVKGSTTTVTVSWEKKNEEQEGDDAEKRTNTSDQMTDEPQMNTVTEENQSTPAVTVTWKKKNKEGEHIGKETAVKGKRKAGSTAETSPTKKTKLINDGFCLFVGNLNTSKKFEEVKVSLANYFLVRSLLVQDIRLDRSRKHAHVDLASELDLTKALTLDGEMFLDKPMKIAKAKVKSEKVKAPPEAKKAAKDAKCLFLKNVPFDATEEDILKVFPKAIAVRFPGGTEGPKKGIAFLEFKTEAIANKVRQHKQGAKIQDRVLIVDFVGETNVSKVSKANDDDDDDNTKAAASSNSTLFVSNLSFSVKEKDLKKVFQTAVSISIPQSKAKPRGFAFVEFATVEDAEKALQSSQNTEICTKKIKIQFCDAREKAEKVKFLSKTLIVMGLAKKTTAETLKSAFEGASDARVTVDKDTGVSRGFGFVEFESEENCNAAKEAMEDCEIDGSKVTVAYAKQKAERGRPSARGGSAGRPGGQPAGRGAGGGKGGSFRGGKDNKGGKGRAAGKSKNGVKGKNKH